MRNPYDVLGVPRDTSVDVCKKVARKLLAKNHPDNGGSSEAFYEVQEAIKSIESGRKVFDTSVMNRKHLIHVKLFKYQVV